MVFEMSPARTSQTTPRKPGQSYKPRIADRDTVGCTFFPFPGQRVSFCKKLSALRPFFPHALSSCKEPSALRLQHQMNTLPIVERTVPAEGQTEWIARRSADSSPRDRVLKVQGHYSVPPCLHGEKFVAFFTRRPFAPGRIKKSLFNDLIFTKGRQAGLTLPFLSFNRLQTAPFGSLPISLKWNLFLSLHYDTNETLPRAPSGIDCHFQFTFFSSKCTMPSDRGYSD